MSLATTIINWYLINKRELPWRETKDPYKIWVSEIIMQQTRVNQGLPYYLRFIQEFPTVSHLANAHETTVLNIWQGLGYYSRARNMHSTAKAIIDFHKGEFPKTSAELKKLKGIGNYTAAAISSICFNENIAAIDGNLTRVIARIYNITEPVDKLETAKTIENICSDLIRDSIAALFNQALMDLGATVCTPKNPICEECPLVSNCLANAKNTQGTIPTKQARTAVKNRFLNYLIFTNNRHTVIKKRALGDIWQGLYDFPLIETDSKKEIDEILTAREFQTLINNQTVTCIQHIEAKPHKLSHQTLHAQFIIMETERLPTMPESITIETDRVIDFPLPKLIERYLSQIFYKM